MPRFFPFDRFLVENEDHARTWGDEGPVPEPDSSALRWRRSSQCTTNTCLEVGRLDGLIWLRNSNRPGATVRITPGEWEVFRAGLLGGDFDDLVAPPDPGGRS